MIALNREHHYAPAAQMASSHFGKELKRLLDKYEIRQVQLGERVGLSDSQISRFVNGTQTLISPKDLAAIVKAATSDPLEQAQLVRAHLLDECNGPGSQLIEISINNDKVSAEFTLPPHFTAEQRRAITALFHESKRNPGITQIFMNLASGMGLIS